MIAFLKEFHFRYHVIRSYEASYQEHHIPCEWWRVAWFVLWNWRLTTQVLQIMHKSLDRHEKAHANRLAVMAAAQLAANPSSPWAGHHGQELTNSASIEGGDTATTRGKK